MKTPTQLIQETLKGCGKVFQQYGVTKCGETHGIITLLCLECQAKLSGLITAFENELEFLESIGVVFFSNKCKYCITNNNKITNKAKERIQNLKEAIKLGKGEK